MTGGALVLLSIICLLAFPVVAHDHVVRDLAALNFPQMIKCTNPDSVQGMAQDTVVGSFSLRSFDKMIKHTVPGSMPIRDYSNYGCYCGLGGSGRPVDQLDRCCQVHDECYGYAQLHGACSNILQSPYFAYYHYTCQQATNTVTCPREKNGECEQFICECDRQAAHCFAQAPYNEKYYRYPQHNCKNIEL